GRQSWWMKPLPRGRENFEASYLAIEEKKKSMPRFPYSVEPYSLRRRERTPVL
ncbi:7801_t:CDS:1, partial [Paraglomus brasilianum]